tara:strand:+ start:275 stop:619 length:345 start_codon:yes stop_codon:yes gene_type:complete
MASPHLSRSKFKMKQSVQALDTENQPKEFRATAFIQFKTEWIEADRRYERMTPEQEKICADLGRKLAEAGVEISVTVSERKDGFDIRDFPKVMQFQMYTNKTEPQKEKSNDVEW